MIKIGGFSMEIWSHLFFWDENRDLLNKIFVKKIASSLLILCFLSSLFIKKILVSVKVNSHR
ncbi:MAG: hypothetical protein DRN08_01540 [Thermoplasmata archaeon]|nr:MAG: hypothetical protein DRN08_01540 [Thermoplasmata archaeon]